MFRGGAAAFGAASFSSGTYKADDGLVGTPSYSFTSLPTTGFYANSGIGISVAGAAIASFGATGLLFQTGKLVAFQAGGNAGTLSDDSATNVIAAKSSTTTAAMEYRIYAGNGGFISNVKSVTESLTIAAAATTVSATSIPAGAILLGVAVRVTTVIPTAATFTMTTTVGGTTLNTAAVTVAANSTDPGTAAGASYRAAATTVTITPNLTPGAATGVVRLQFYYLQVTPPTS